MALASQSPGHRCGVREERKVITDNAAIRRAFERNARIVTTRPAVAQKTYVTRVHIRDGLTCDIEEGPWTLTADLSTIAGGNAAGPTPGTLARAALGSCLAMSYVMWAAQLNVPLHQIAVEVQADTDLRGMYGVDDIPAGYSAIRYVVSVRSPASHEAILRVLDIAEAHSPYVDVFRRPQVLQRQLHLSEE
jgi:uncharacterized OsmC-like protein